jgi:hypothetical protein
MLAIEPGCKALLAGVAVVISTRASPARPPFSRFHFPVEQCTTLPPRAPTRTGARSVEPFRHVGLTSVRKAPLFWVARFTWCRLVVGRSGFCRACSSCTCRRGRADRQADADARPCIHEPAPRRTPTCACARASARAFLHKAVGFLTHAASRARA